MERNDQTHSAGLKNAVQNVTSAPKISVSPTGEATILPPAQFRMVTVSLLAAGVGILAGFVAFALYKLIGLFTNLVFYNRLSAEFLSARHNHLGPWVILMPVIGGIIIGFMAKYGTDKITGHGIP